MKIDRTGSAGRSSETRRSSRGTRVGKGAFARELEQAAGTAAMTGVGPAAGGAPVEGIEALWALQEVDSVAQDRQAARQRGEHLLDKLEALQHALLAGAIDPADLEALAMAARSGGHAVQDARLRAVLAEIELRAEVELAKYARDTADPQAAGPPPGRTEGDGAAGGAAGGDHGDA